MFSGDGDPLRVYQLGEDFKLRRGEMECFSLEIDRLPFGLKIALGGCRGRVPLGAAAQEREDAGVEFFGVVGFGEVVLGTKFKTGEFVVDV